MAVHVGGISTFVGIGGREGGARLYQLTLLTCGGQTGIGTFLTNGRTGWDRLISGGADNKHHHDRLMGWATRCDPLGVCY